MTRIWFLEVKSYSKVQELLKCADCIKILVLTHTERCVYTKKRHPRLFWEKGMVVELTQRQLFCEGDLSNQVQHFFNSSSNNSAGDL